MKCLFCGMEFTDPDLSICPNCGKKFIQRSVARVREDKEEEDLPLSNWSEELPVELVASEHTGTEGTILPIIAGILLMLIGVVGAIVGFLAFTVESMIPLSSFSNSVGGLGMIGGLLSILVVIGGFFAVTRTHFVIASLASAIAILIGIASPIFIATFLGLVALGVLSSSHLEFD